MKTAGELMISISERLKQVGIDNPQLDAKFFVAHACDVEPSSLYSGSSLEVPEDKIEIINSYVKRRLDKEPVFRILGKREFWSLEFELSPETLEPRPDSETVIEAILENVSKQKALDIVDMGTGTGCLLLSALSEFPRAKGVGIDIASGAVETAMKNARNLGLSDRSKIVNVNWGDVDFSSMVCGLTEKGYFDVVIANPPYIPREDIELISSEVKNHDPIRALDGGEDGLDAYRTLSEKSAQLLKKGGMVFFEVGINQAEDVKQMLEKKGFVECKTKKDLAHIDRCVFGVKS
jgi:release factor glutamine methyltransferase